MSGYPYHLPLCNSWGQVVWDEAPGVFRRRADERGQRRWRSMAGSV